MLMSASSVPPMHPLNPKWLALTHRVISLPEPSSLTILSSPPSC